MAAVYAIGPEDAVLGFASVGIRPVGMEKGEALIPALGRIAAEPDTALILICEELAEGRLHEIEEIRRRNNAAIVFIASHHGSRGLGIRMIRSQIEKSIGVDMLKERRS
ncbi:MAG TPA: V-type ATP synthase subunit F [Candidatus Brocadiia bacterium]|nr:V-type ATP synthase subunit F [Candidatus Brocadiia bacterium]